MTINPTGTESHFKTLPAAVTKAINNAVSDELPQTVCCSNRYGHLLVDPDGTLLVEDAHAHQADWDGDLRRSGLAE